MDLDNKGIHFRDRWQLELKSEYRADEKNSSREFYFFIPNSLQIHPATYSSREFYRDQTNLIRYKTPVYTMDELIGKNSPIETIELKLLGNIIRSTMRRTVQKLKEEKDMLNFVEQFNVLNAMIRELDVEEKNKETATYVKEFINQSAEYYLTALLERARKKQFKKADNALCNAINPLLENDNASEEFLYKKGLLNKFVLDALLLYTSRYSPTKKYQNLIGAFAAAIAMLFFFVLFVWGGQLLVRDSTPFILITVFLYVIKDRIKEWIRSLPSKNTLLWSYDYATDIYSPNNDQILGKLTESMTYIKEKKLPTDIRAIRNKEFHDVLESFKRPESIVYYKKAMAIYPENDRPLNTIFRFNVQHFLAKADDPLHNYTVLDPETNALHLERLPKVYHLNIILKTTIENMPPRFEKYRVILDKAGIKRVDQL